jgi:hypothetical protein
LAAQSFSSFFDSFFSITGIVFMGDGHFTLGTVHHVEKLLDFHWIHGRAENGCETQDREKKHITHFLFHSSPQKQAQLCPELDQLIGRGLSGVIEAAGVGERIPAVPKAAAEHRHRQNQGVGDLR